MTSVIQNINTNNKCVLLIDLQYFANINYYTSLFNSTYIIFEVYENWKKSVFSNKTCLMGVNGQTDLTVPILGGRTQKGILKEIKIDNTQNWQQQHWKTIISNYGRSPFFEWYSPWLDNFYTMKFEYLTDMNIEIIKWTKACLKMEAEIGFTTNYQKQYEEEILDKRNFNLPKNYLEQPFNLKYTQVFEEKIGFKPNLSILDLLFCEGPNSTNLLLKGNNSEL